MQYTYLSSARTGDFLSLDQERIEKADVYWGSSFITRRPALPPLEFRGPFSLSWTSPTILGHV